MMPCGTALTEENGIRTTLKIHAVDGVPVHGMSVKK